MSYTSASVTPQLVLTESAALVMRLIRNECRFWMTNNQNEISTEDQLEWFNSIDRNEVLPWLFREPNQIVVAYSLMRRGSANKWWLSIGVAEAHRGVGYGTAAFEYMTGLVDEAWLEVGIHNTVAQRIYRKLGYELTETLHDRLIMVHRR